MARKLGHVPAVRIEAMNDVHSATNAFEKRAWPHSPRNGDAPANVGEIKQAVAELDAADIIAHEYGTAAQLIVRHAPLPDTQKRGDGVEIITQSLTVAA